MSFDPSTPLYLDATFLLEGWGVQKFLRIVDTARVLI